MADKVTLAGNYDSLTELGARGVLDLDWEGWYYIAIEGTLGASTVIVPWIQPNGANIYDKIEHPRTGDDTEFTVDSRKIILVPGNSTVKFVVTDYSGSSNVVARRIRAAKGA
jgi:hypothetical protein